MFEPATDARERDQHTQTAARTPWQRPQMRLLAVRNTECNEGPGGDGTSQTS